MFEIVFYRDKKGNCPVKIFLDSTSTKMRARLLMIMSLLERNGPSLREPYSKSIGNGIFEIRAKSGSDIARVFYFFAEGKRIIVTNGFIKKSQKLPKKEIRMAEKYRSDYLSREVR